MPSEWTRVFSRDDMGGRRASVFALGPDLIYDKAMRDALLDQEEQTGYVLFSPQNFRPQDLADDLDTVRLTDEELIHFGQLATTAKKHFAQLATDLSAFDDDYQEEDKSDRGAQVMSLIRSYSRKKDRLSASNLIERMKGSDKELRRKPIKRC